MNSKQEGSSTTSDYLSLVLAATNVGGEYERVDLS